MRKIIAVITLSVLIQSCGQKETTQQEGAEHDTLSHEYAPDPRTIEIMAIHDSIMPAMERIMSFKGKLKKELTSLDSLLALKKDAALEKRKTEAGVVLEQLEKADHEMMNWMHQYRADTLQKLDSAQAALYLKDQKIKIEAVRETMRHSIDQAGTFSERK